MATYLTLNSKFTPYTYEEILKPYQDRQKALEDKLTALEETYAKANLWEGILDPVADKAYYDSFNQFKSRLEDLSGRLSAGDASAVTKQELSKLKQEYNKQFAPMELKYAELKQAQEDQRKAALQAAVAGKNIRFTKDMQGVPLSSTLTDPTWNKYGIINLDDIAEQSVAAGASYGKNAAFYNVFGTTRGNTAPEDINTSLDRLYKQYIPTGVSTALSDEIKGVINNSFLLGSQQSYAKDISDILDTDTARSIQAKQADAAITNAMTARYELLAGLQAKGQTIKDGKIVNIDGGTDEEDKTSSTGVDYSKLKFDNNYPQLHYLEDADGNRKYYKKNSENNYSEVPMDGSKVAFKQNGKMKYYDYKEDKVYIKDQDGNYVEDVTKERSSTYNNEERKKARDDFKNKYNNVLYINKNEILKYSEMKEGLDYINTLEEDRIEIIPAEEFIKENSYNIRDKFYEEWKIQIALTGYDPDQLIVIRDKDNPNKAFIVLKNETELPVSYLSNYPKLYMKANGMEAIEENLTPSSGQKAFNGFQ